MSEETDKFRWGKKSKEINSLWIIKTGFWSTGLLLCERRALISLPRGSSMKKEKLRILDRWADMRSFVCLLCGKAIARTPNTSIYIIYLLLNISRPSPLNILIWQDWTLGAVSFVRFSAGSCSRICPTSPGVFGYHIDLTIYLLCANLSPSKIFRFYLADIGLISVSRASDRWRHDR